MKILHIVAAMPPESGVAAVATRLAVEQQGLGCEVCVATTEVGKVAVDSSSRQLEGRTPRQGEADPEQNIEHPPSQCLRRTGRTSNIEHPPSRIRLRRTGRTSDIEHLTGERNVRVVTFRRNWPHFLCFSWGMLLGLGKMVKDVDVVHVHSNWTFPVWWGAWLALRHQKTLVMSPHGCLDPVRLKHSGWKKRLVGWIDRWLLRRASVIHATCEEEAGWIQPFLKFEPTSLAATPSQGSSKVLNLRGPKIVVIPNGVEEVH